MPSTEDHSTLDIAVVIPWGKAGATLDRALSSALAQDLAAHQVIVVANGSVTRAILSESMHQYRSDPIRFVYIPGCRNANIARNLGTALATTTYIAYLDSDDWWNSDHLSSSLNALNSYRADLIYSGMRIHLPDDNIEERISSDWRRYGSMESYCLNYQAAPTSSLLTRRSCALDIMWDVSLARHQDYDFKARFARRYKTTFKEDITVHVDWQQPRRHRHHTDCFRVLDAWRSRTDHDLYRRHFVNLCRGAVQARDPVLLRTAPACLKYWLVIKLLGLRDKLFSRHAPTTAPNEPEA